MSERIRTMCDGGEPIEPDPNAGNDPGSDPGNDPGGNDPESYELYGNKYAKDDDGIAKLIEDSKNIERALTDKSTQLARLQGLVDEKAPDNSVDNAGEDENQFPFDTEDMEEEDKKAAQALQTYIKNEIQSGIEKGLEPIRDKELDQDIQNEIKEIEATHGKVNQDELIRFARDNGLESNLVHAHKVMTYDDQIQKGRQQEQSDRKRKEGAFLPSGSGTNNSKVPKYNKKEHGDKGYGELLDKNL